MRKIFLLLVIIMPYIVQAQKIDEQKLAAQLKAITKGKSEDFRHLRGKIKDNKTYDTSFYSKSALLYSIDTNNVIYGNIYSVYFNPRELKFPVKDLTDVLRKIIANTDFGYGKMELTHFDDQLHKYEYTSKPKKLDEERYITLHIDLRYDLFLSITKEITY